MASSLQPLVAIQTITGSDTHLAHRDDSQIGLLPTQASPTGRLNEITQLELNHRCESLQISSYNSPSSTPTNGRISEQDEYIDHSNDEKDKIQRTGKVVDSTEFKKAEIDTAAPFESVKAALTLFGERVERPQQIHDTQMPSFERHTVSEMDLQRIRDDIASYQKRISDMKACTNDVLLELESVKKKIIQAGSGNVKDSNILNLNHISDSKFSGANELLNAATVSSQRTTEVLKIMKDIENVKGELLYAKASCDMEKRRLESSQVSLDRVSKRKEELIKEQLSLSETMVSAQSELADVEEQVEMLRSGKELEFPKRILSDSIEQRTAEINLLQSKLEKTNLSVRKLKDELAAPKESQSRSAADIEVNEYIRNVRSQLDQARSEERIKVEKLAKISAELHHVKSTLEKAREEHASLLSSLLSSEKEKENVRIELENTHEKERAACASLASLQDELRKAKESLLSAQDGARRALDAKETLPMAIKQAVLEAENVKGKAEGSKEEERRARHEMEQSKAAIGTILRRNAAVLKEVEAARTSETIALAHLESLNKSETHNDAKMVTESGVTISSEEYKRLKQAADIAEDIAKERVDEALALVEQAKSGHIAAQASLDDVDGKTMSLRKELEVVQKSDEDAQIAKSASEAELRNWRSEHEQQRQIPGIPPNDLHKRKLRNDQQHAQLVDKADSVSEVSGLTIPTLEKATTKVYSPMELDGRSQGKESLKKKTLISRLTSAVSRKPKTS